ncbi:alcohol dehydrogenase catalytic domain-containing protein [Methanocrinis sp.]|uniref:alcohol dehydrogenase catalytic domain-containing protein n=1 Tax=Methanocrinis sp. TaxID=3101522 RepID=UPI003D0F8040
MMAAVLEAPGRMALREVEDPVCPRGGLILKVEACSICSTDVKMLKGGQRDLVYPRILGHEIAGVVSERDGVGPGVGEGVQIFPGVFCGSCPSCRRGAENMCERIQIFGFNLDGGFAEYLSVPGGSARNGGVNLIPDGLDFELAALAEPLACSINAQERVGVGEGDSILIFGAGPAGFLHTHLARERGASTVAIVEPLEERADLARASGADLVINSGGEDLFELAMELTGGMGFDVIVLASRDVAVDADLLALLAPRGRISLFSGLPPEIAVPHLDLNHLHYREKMIAGSYGCTPAQNREALEIISGHPDLSQLITERVSLAEMMRGMEHAERREGLKAVVTNFGG